MRRDLEEERGQPCPLEKRTACCSGGQSCPRTGQSHFQPLRRSKPYLPTLVCPSKSLRFCCSVASIRFRLAAKCSYFANFSAVHALAS